MLPVSGRRDAADTDSSGAGESLVHLLSSQLRACCSTRRFGRGEEIVREGDPGGDAFILLSGRCEVTVHGDTLNVIRPGELFGEIACLGAGTRTATVRAADDSDVLVLAGDTLKEELRRSPALLETCLRAMAHRVRHISRRETRVRDEQRGLRRVLEDLHPSLDIFENHPRLSVEVRWQPLSITSGDYYDVLPLAPDRFLFALGDVMGHGAPTTPIVGMIRGQLHESAGAESRPHELLARLHRHLRRHGPPNVFMTLTLLVLDVASGSADVSVGGPPCPLLYRGGQCAPITSDFGWTIGYPFENISFATERVPLGPGDTVIFYTDGLSEAMRGPDPDLDALGVEGLARIVSDACSGHSAGIVDATFSGVDAYRAGWPADDDATALSVHLR